MLKQIIAFSVKNKLIIILFILSLVIYGGYEVTRLPIDAVPDITDNQVQVITVSPSLGAPDIERLITFPIEQSCSNIPGLKQMRSFSRFGLSLVTIVFNDGIDIYWARQQISERLQQVQQDIPAGIGVPAMAPVSTGLGEIYQYIIRPKSGYEGKYDAMQLRTIQEWIVRRKLLGTPGVAEVSSFGGKLKQYEIAVRQEQLKAFNITIADVFNALEKNNQNTGGAYIEKGPTVLYIRSEGLTASIDDIQKIVVKTLSNGMPVLMRDVAIVQYGAAIRYGAMTYNDKGEVSGAVVMMLKGENSSAVIKRVKAKVEEIQKMLPEGVVIEPFLDRTKMVNNAIKTVETNLMEGALIVIFVLVFFLGNFRAGLIVSSVIPLSMLFAIILMNMFGVGGNLMSLGAIDFGLIVDGSVIVVEAILHRFQHSKHFRNMTQISQADMDAEVGTSTGAMIKSAVFSQIIILIVYLPILSLQGIEGKMFKPMAYTIAFAILGAFILSITYVPMMAALCLNKKLKHKHSISDRFIIWIEKKYQPLLNKLLDYPKTIISVTILLFATAAFILSRMGGEFMPQLEEGDFAVETRLLTGSNLDNTIKSTQQASKILLQRFPEVEKVVAKIGSSEIPTDPMPFEAADVMVILKDKKEWTSAASFSELSNKMTKALEEVPGITVGFQFPVQMRFNELITGARQDIVCKIFGENLDSLATYAHQLSDIIKTVDGAINIYEEKVTGMPQVVIKYNRDAMAKYGLNVSDVNRIVNTAFAGQVAGQVYEGERRFDLVVRMAGEGRKNISDIRNLFIPTASGTQIPLSIVADINEIDGVNQIQRENTRRRVIVGFNVQGRDVQSLVKELQQKAGKELKLPREYTIVYGGSFENMNAAKERLSIVVPIALALIFLLLYFAFNSVRQGLLIYSAIPLSAIGGIFGLWIRGMPFSISAGVGFIALFGVAVLNGILLVSEFNRLKAEGWHDVRRIVIHATKSKLRAVLMTALVPSLGFIPMAISTGAGGEVQKPLATVVIGGLIISTLLTLFVLPVLYILFEKMSIKTKNKTAVLALMFIFVPFITNAQQKISLRSAIDTALQNNLKLKGERMTAEYLKRLNSSAWNLPQTNITTEWGNVNSAYNDTRFGIAQNIAFPTVYLRQKHVLHDEWKSGALLTQVREKELVKQVTQLYYEMCYLMQKQILLTYADSVYATFQQKAGLRYKLGETNLLEKTTAETQRGQVRLQSEQLNRDFEILQLQFSYLLNSTILFVPDQLDFKMDVPDISDVSLALQHPYLQYLRQQKELATAMKKMETAKLMPDLQISWYNQSFSGWQKVNNDERLFGMTDRFNSVQVGIGIPLFFASQTARIKAMNINVRIAENKLQDGYSLLNLQYAQLLQQYDKNRSAVDYFEKIALNNVETIIKTAGSQFAGGDINYLEYAMLINQSVSIRSDYLDAVKKLNETISEINYLTK